MLKNFIRLSIFFIICNIFSCNDSNKINYRDKKINKSIYSYSYKSGNWDHPNYREPFNFLGNHRVVVELPKKSDEIHQVKIPWRRRDDLPSKKDVIIINSETGKEISEKYFLEINNMEGHILFRPEINSLKYFFYYLPHKSTGGYYPKVEYKKPITSNNLEWNNQIKDVLGNISSIKNAQIKSFESIDDFHSFFPMEVISSDDEVGRYVNNFDKEVFMFPEYRNYPIRMMDFLPLRWTNNFKNINGLEDNVSIGEYYTFQIGLFSPNMDIDDIEIYYSDLKSNAKQYISKENFTCFNKGGTDLLGNNFIKKVSVPKNKVQSLWFGLQVPNNTVKGKYKSYIVVKPNGMKPDTIHLKLNVQNKLLKDFGDSNPKMMSRLRWLNSKIGSENDLIIKPFDKVEIQDKSIKILGREVILNSFGLPDNILSYFSQEMTYLNDKPNDILSGGMSLDVLGNNGKIEKFKNQKFDLTQSSAANAQWQSKNVSENFLMDIFGLMEYDGMLDLKIRLIAKNNKLLDDINFRFSMVRDATKYMLGLGRKGGEFNKNISWKWDITKHQEGIWLGNVNKGLQYVLRDNKYERPLNTNFYQSKPLNLPESWYNDSKGGILVNIDSDEVLINNYSGDRMVMEGDTLHFNIRFLITPFKLINTKEHFNTRFVHKFLPIDSVEALNGTIVNVHHANEINPYINYPFYNLEKQKKYIDDAHAKGIKVKLYNTIRELTYKTYEIFPLRSLGNEIFNSGKGGGHGWLQEHLKRDYHSAWHAVNVNDASILNKGTSRWTNYYIEGINWLAKNNDIDGLYLDDIAFSRSTVKRIASVLNRNRESFVIDLHSANQFNNRDGFINSALLYMEHFPYVSRLWFGEYFDYNLNPDFWMAEVAGIPFGLTGEMLEKGGRPYHGLVFGMTTRVYHNYNPGNLWKLFEDFGIADSRMIGYWVDDSPVKVDNEKIKCTIYQKDDKVMISIASWSNKDEFLKLNINWNKLGFDKFKSSLTSPLISDLQGKYKFEIDEEIRIEKNSGIVLILSEN